MLSIINKLIIMANSTDVILVHLKQQKVLFGENESLAKSELDVIEAVWFFDSPMYAIYKRMYKVCSDFNKDNDDYKYSFEIVKFFKNGDDITIDLSKCKCNTLVLNAK